MTMMPQRQPGSGSRRRGGLGKPLSHGNDGHGNTKRPGRTRPTTSGVSGKRRVNKARQMRDAFWDEPKVNHGVVPGLYQMAKQTPWPGVVLLLAFVMPPETNIMVGTLRLSPYRIVLLLMFLPCVLSLITGRLGRICLADWLVLLHVIWVMLAMAVHHGITQSIESGGIYMVETFGSYLVARRVVRDVTTFRGAIATVALIVYGLAVFALYEVLTGQHILREIARMGLGGPPIPHIDNRLGLHRAFGTFEHPILYGVFCASIISSLFLAMPPTMAGYVRWLRTFGAMAAAAMAVSAGPMAAVFTQLYALIYESVTRIFNLNRRWLILAIIIVTGYITVDILSNRTPVNVALHYLTFSRATAFNRLLIWEYGSAEVWRNPIFGIGFNDWSRPRWMSRSGSVDNFWLLTSMRYGIPAFAILATTMLYLIYQLAKRKVLSSAQMRIRMAWIIGIFALFIAGCTVHFWNALFSYYFFFLGTIVWLVTVPDKQLARTDSPVAQRVRQNLTSSRTSPARRR